MVNVRKYFTQDLQIKELLSFPQSKSLREYFFAISVAIGGFLVAQLYSSFGLRYRTLSFVLAVMLTAQVTSFPAALVASVVSVILMGYFFTFPVASFPAVITELIGLGVFFIVCIIMSVIITRLKWLTKDAVQQKHWLSLTLGSISDAVITTNRFGKIQFMNQAAEEMTGWSAEEVQGLRMQNLLHLKKKQVKGKSGVSLITLQTKDQQTISTEINRTYLKRSDGFTVGHVYILRDTSLKKKIHEYETQLTALVESSADAIIGKDLHGNIISWNKAAQKMYGYTEKEAIGKHVSLIAPTTETDIPEIIHALKKGKKIVDYETVRIRKDGAQIEVALTISPMKDSEGKYIGASTIARDITHRKRAEAMNKREMELQNFLTTASQQLFSSIDFDSAVHQVAQFAVPYICDMCQVSIIEDAKLRVAAIAHVDENKKKLAEQIAELYPLNITDKNGSAGVIRTGKSIFIQTVTPNLLRQKVKSKKHLQLLKQLEIISQMIVPLKQNKQTFGAITFLATKDSGRQFSKSDLYYAEELARRAAIALQNSQLYASAQKAIQLRDEFFSIASHELKTPITSIKAFIQIMQRSFNKKDDLVAQRLLARTNNQVDKLIFLVRDLLDITKIQSGKLSLNCIEHNIGTVVQEAVSDYQTTTPTHQIVLENVLQQSFKFDKERVEQVLNNLLSNAVKYSPDADKVIVKMAEQDDGVLLSVQDFGVGIAKQHLSKVFDRFYRSNPEQLGSLSSLGLGLYIASEIISRHNGKMWVESELGKGSTFYFWLPVE
jgi:PAS domain S-box-containing protein